MRPPRAFPGVGAAADEGETGAAQQARVAERAEDPNGGGGVAGHDPGGLLAERVEVVGLGNEGHTGEFTTLAALEDLLDAGSVVAGLVCRANVLRCGVDDDVDVGEQLAQLPSRLEPRGSRHR